MIGIQSAHCALPCKNSKKYRNKRRSPNKSTQNIRKKDEIEPYFVFCLYWNQIHTVLLLSVYKQTLYLIIGYACS